MSPLLTSKADSNSRLVSFTSILAVHIVCMCCGCSERPDDAPGGVKQGHVERSTRNPSAPGLSPPKASASSTVTTIERTPGNQTVQSQIVTNESDSAVSVPSTIGLTFLQRQPITDQWQIVRTRFSGPPHISSQTIGRVQQAKEKAQDLHKPNQKEVRVDLDSDGHTDFWVYFEGTRPMFVEADRYATGCRDLRMDVSTDELKAADYDAWAIAPPIPMHIDVPPMLGPEECFDWIASVDNDGGEHALFKFTARFLPTIVRGLPDAATDELDDRILPFLERYRKQAEQLHPQFVEYLSQDRQLQEKLRQPWEAVRAWTTEYKYWVAQPDFAAGYTPTGVSRVQFFEEGWEKWKRQRTLWETTGKGDPYAGLAAECALDSGNVKWIDVKGRRFLRLGRFWARIRPEFRRTIAERYLLPALHAYLQGEWYQAVRTAEAGVYLTGLLGDTVFDKVGGIDRSPLLNGWNFEVHGAPARSLLKVSVGLRWMYSRGISQGIHALAEAAVQERDYVRSVRLYRLAQRFCVKGGYSWTEYQLLQELAPIYQRLGNYDLAIECLFDSLDVQSSASYALELARVLRKDAAGVSEGMSARHKLNRSLEMRSHIARIRRGCTLATIALLYSELGERKKAEGYLIEAERLLNSTGNKFTAAGIANVRARWDLADGRWELAYERAKHALDIARQQVAVQQQDELGSAFLKQGHAVQTSVFHDPYSSMSAPLQAVFAGNSHPFSYQATSASLMAQALLHRALNVRESSPVEFAQLIQESKKVQQQAVEWCEDAKDELGALIGRVSLAELALHREVFAEALQEAKSLEARSGAENVFEIGWRAAAIQGVALLSLERREEARQRFESAADMIEAARARLHSEPVRRGFFGAKSRIYESLVSIYATDGEFEKAWQSMERSKARTLLDVIGGRKLTPKGRVASELINNPELRSWTEANIYGTRTVENGTQRRRRLDPLQHEIVSLYRVLPVTLDDVQAVLDPDTLLVEYFSTEQELFVIIISAKTFRLIRLPEWGRSKLRQKVNDFRRQIEARWPYDKLARELYDALVAPCFVEHTQYRHLCIVPSDVLYYLPFQCLLTPKRSFVIEDAFVSYASSAAALVFARSRARALGDQDDAELLVVADPRVSGEFEQLPFARIEGRRIHKAFPRSRLLEGREATESSTKAEMVRAGIVHFCGHSRLEPNMPMRSALMCAADPGNDGRLEVRELFDMEFKKCHLAVLSACETSRDRWSRGDEFVGLSRSFLRAGVPSVIATFWQIRDESTFRVMVRFYELMAEGRSKVEALTLAQREFLQNRLENIQLTTDEKVLVANIQSYSTIRATVTLNPDSDIGGDRRGEDDRTRPHPYLWSAFQLIGEWE